MTDPLAQAQAFIDRAVEERDGLKHQLSTAMTANFQIRRQLERARESIAARESEMARLEHELDVAHKRVEQAERATRDHVARA